MSSAGPSKESAIKDQGNERDDLFTPQSQRTIDMPTEGDSSSSFLQRLDIQNAPNSYVAPTDGENNITFISTSRTHPSYGELRLPGSDFGFRASSGIAVGGDGSGTVTNARKRLRSNHADVWTELYDEDDIPGYNCGTLDELLPERPPRKYRKTPARVAIGEDKEEQRDQSYRPSRSLPKPGPGLRRRSTRLQLMTPATSFDRVFNLLPSELKLAIWRLAADDDSNKRCVYLRNRAAEGFQNGMITPLPAKFHTTTVAREVVMKNYKRMFARLMTEQDSMTLQSQIFVPGARMPGPPQPRYGVSLKLFPEPPNQFYPPYLDFDNYQYVNPDVDIVVYEPCCRGCRAYHCAKTQFSNSDREAVRFLAIRPEPKNLGANARPCYLSVAWAWPGVETLYIITNAKQVDWEETVEWALVHDTSTGVKERDLESRFEEWKQVDGWMGGKDKAIKEIEFVRLLPKKKPKKGEEPGEQYFWDWVSPEDIIIG